MLRAGLLNPTRRFRRMSSQPSESRGFSVGHMVVGGLAVGVVGALVFQRAWVSDDGLFTLRYVQNMLEGLGPVYNAGERVQGYTHPLWFLLLVLGTRFFGDAYLVAIGLGLVLSAATVAVLAWGLFRLSRGAWPWPSALLAAALLVLASSGSWLSFQTGGLENSLTHLLVVLWVLELLRDGPLRSGRLVLVSALICLSRPDLLFLVGPAGLLAVWRARTASSVARVGLATIPALAWIAFAWAYYGTPVPNTATAKLGIYPTRWDAVSQGLAYLVDWSFFEPFAALATVVGAWLIVRLGVGPAGKLLVVGLVAQTAWVVWIGGDFMRGRLLLPVLTAAVAGAVVAAVRWAEPKRSLAVGLSIVAILALGVVGQARFGLAATAGVNGFGIADEWRFYPGYHLRSVRETGRIMAIDGKTRLADQLKEYVEKCGPITMHATNPAYLGYVVGPDLHLIDALGLTDSHVARLPRDLLVMERLRPGHPYRKLPRAYLWSHGDIRLVQGWEEAIRAGDCSLKARATSGRRPNGYADPVPLREWL